MNTLAVISYPQMFQRFFAAEDERAFRALLVWWPVMALVAALIPVLLGVWGTELVPGLANPDTVIAALLKQLVASENRSEFTSVRSDRHATSYLSVS
jgi:SSS family solute:Na+ symporter